METSLRKEIEAWSGTEPAVRFLAVVSINCSVTMLRHRIPHAESTRSCERSSLCDAIFWRPGMGGARSATGDAAGTEAFAHRDERIASGSRTIACDGPRSAQHRGISFCLCQENHGEPGPLATRSGTPARVNRGSAAMVAILVALS